MIRSIQRGRGTLQGPLIGKVWRLCVGFDGMTPIRADFGTIRSPRGAVWGRLIEDPKRKEAADDDALS
jgi:hypothetical protein